MKGDDFAKVNLEKLEVIKNYKFICRGTGIEWEGLDYHLSIESMLSANFISHRREIAWLQSDTGVEQNFWSGTIRDGAQHRNGPVGPFTAAHAVGVSSCIRKAS